MKIVIVYLSIIAASGLFMITLYNSLVDARSWVLISRRPLKPQDGIIYMQTRGIFSSSLHLSTRH